MQSIKGSNGCSKSELDLFYSLPTNTSITSSNYTNITLANLSGEEPSFEINVPGTDEYTDLSDIYLKLEVSIEKDSTRLTSTSKVGPINNFGHSLFKKIELKIGAGLNRKLVEVGNSHYAYKAYLLNLLNFGQDAKSTWLKSSLFYKDTEGEFDSIVTESSKKKRVKLEGEVNESELDIFEAVDANNGFIRRRNFFLNSKGKINIIIIIHCDLMHTNRFLLNNIGMFFEFERNKDNFLLMGEVDHKVKIKKVNMLVRKCQIHQSVKMAHISALQISPAKYPIKQKKVTCIMVDTGSQEYDISSFGHMIPSKIILGLVSDQAYNGSLNKNPFNFLPHHVSKITLIIDNVSKVIEINQENNDFAEGYHALVEGLNIYGGEGNDISISDYSKGNCLFFFNLNPDKGYCEQYNVIKSGSIQVKLEFSKEVSEKLRLIAFMEYDNQINIDKKHEILFDYDL